MKKNPTLFSMKIISTNEGAGNRQLFHLASLLCLCLLFFLWSLLPLAVHADGGAPNLAYVSGTASGVSVIDIAQQRISRTLALDGEPQTILLGLDGSFLYAAQPVPGQVAVIEAATGRVRCSVSIPGKPSLLALPLVEDALYVAGNGDTNVRAIDPATCGIIHTFHAPGLVYGLALSLMSGAFPGSTGGYQLWVATTNALTVMDTDGKQLANFSLPAGPEHIAIPLGTIVYVTTRQGTVIAIDPFSHRVTSPLLQGGAFGQMDYDENTGEIYVPDAQHGQVDVLAPLSSGAQEGSHQPNRIIHLNGVPEAIAITGDGQFGFAARQDGSVTMLDIPGRRIVTTIAVGGHPHFIITGLYPPAHSTLPNTPPPQESAQSSITVNILVIVICAFTIVFLILALLLLLHLRPVPGTGRQKQRRPPRYR